MMKRTIWITVMVSVLLPAALFAAGAGQSSKRVAILPGPVNGVVIDTGKSRIVVYGDPKDMIKEAAAVLFTHSRRDVVWAGRKLVENGATAIVPAAEADKFTEADGFWREFPQKRYHDYAQQTTKIITRPMRIAHAAKGGESLDVHGVNFEVIDTPGYTRGAVSYLTKIGGVNYAFVGDLIYGDGQLLDLYSLQDAVAEAKIGGYHGWAGRMGELIQSLRKVAAKKPDILVPVRGPVINNPQQAIDKLIARLQAVYRNYLSISAGRWYFKESYDTLAARVLGPDPRVDWMKWAVKINKQPPDWIVCIGNSRLIMAADGRGFLIDCGGTHIVKELQKRRSDGRLKRLDGLFMTHYHDDHTNAVGDLLKEFPCPVYACEPLAQILKSPWAFRLPAMTDHPIVDIKIMRHKQKMRWKDFDLTFYDFPGQTIYHDAMLVQKDDAEKIFFIGDSFTPSGLDDYCLLNRNILHERGGYFYCLDILRTMPADTLLINQHVVETFAFSPDQINSMTWILKQRRDLMKPLFPWSNPNFGIDERWARFFPYGLKTRPGGTVQMAINILNHSDDVATFTVHPNPPAGLQCTPADVSLHISPHREKHVDFSITVKADTPPGVYVITADIAFNNRTLKQWCEGIIEVAPASPIGSRPGK